MWRLIRYLFNAYNEKPKYLWTILFCPYVKWKIVLSVVQTLFVYIKAK
jgi:hypothetical protein